VILFAGIPVSDIASGREWHETFLGRSPDMVPNEREVCWQVADGGWIYVVEDADRTGKGLLTLLVDDLDAELAKLAERGVEPGSLDVIPNAARKAEFVDPDGNRITLGQPLT
jgi:predicted enzyme related to lactoylglutathione lyase